ncbi:MAG: MgtC/SapB family protein, partial [Alphaproteobacteria bacterium]|nr:MgtC/SapB family protein [Alphaproteobacteria bacterium]
PVAVVIQFRRNVFPREEMVRQIAAQHGYEIAKGTISINYRQGQAEWRFVAISFSKDKGLPIADMAEKLASFDGVDSFQLSRARN